MEDTMLESEAPVAIIVRISQQQEFIDFITAQLDKVNKEDLSSLTIAQLQIQTTSTLLLLITILEGSI